MFCLSAHNMITANFAVSVGQGIEKLVLNPSAEFVTSNLGSKSISQFSKIGCKTSKKLLQHKMWPNQMELGRRDACLLLVHAKEFPKLNMIHRGWLDETKNITMEIELNQEKLHESVLDSRARKVNSAELDTDPKPRQSNDRHIW
jgi:hypothetical protein